MKFTVMDFLTVSGVVAIAPHLRKRLDSWMLPNRIQPKTGSLIELSRLTTSLSIVIYAVKDLRSP
jgi:hypothetical protein